MNKAHFSWLYLVKSTLIGCFMSSVGQAEPVSLEWADLLPVDVSKGTRVVRTGVVQHWQIVKTNPFLKAMYPPEDKKVFEARADLDGKTAELTGYILPVRFEEDRLIDFLLVPYIGACVHVPAPPRNQMVFVTGAQGIEAERPHTLYFAEYSVTGKLAVKDTDTRFGAAAYELGALNLTRISEDPLLSWRPELQERSTGK
ncbi:DUF3299 domain-containing protein [Labrenzia sp. VG12]|uniref:DUF3299 domain-containing protein n=1 Tax=Labrenzia sp. VG12 TaxID=2021862 RepID=UPI000B8BB969|nr:DUF3299 domain-containing protein [Labrenzia sp. VG12]ASP32685.1 hypothetical protein CHH27_05030 [Labrenzia sp. VG12]